MTENCHFKWKKNKLDSTAAPLIQHISPLQKHIRNPSHRTQYNSRAGRTNKASRGFSYTQSETCARRRAVQKKKEEENKKRTLKRKRKREEHPRSRARCGKRREQKRQKRMRAIIRFSKTRARCTPRAVLFKLNFFYKD